MWSARFLDAGMNMTEHPLNASLPQQGQTIPQPSNFTQHVRDNATCGATSGGRDCWQEEEEAPALISRTEVTLLAAVLLAVFLCSVVANGLVCVLFTRRRGSLSLSDRFLANLTVCNGLFTLLVMPVALTSLLSRRWVFGPVLCQGMGLTVNLLVSASIFTLVVISLDRYCAVVTPLHYSMRMTRRRCGAFIAAIWTASLVVSSPPLLGWNSFRFHMNSMICTVAWGSVDLADRYYTLLLVTLSFLLPLTTMLWTYSCIFRAARDNSERTWRSSTVPTVQAECEPCQCTPVGKRRRSSSLPILRRLSQTSCRSGSLLQRREEWKTAVTSFLILFSFTLCWLPYFLVILLRSLAPSLTLHPVLGPLSTAAALVACACNPLVYVFRSKATRRDLKVILTRRRSFGDEVLNAVRPGGSGRGEGAGERKEDREKGSVFWQEERRSHGECRSIQEEGDVPWERPSSGSKACSVSMAPPGTSDPSSSGCLQHC